MTVGGSTSGKFFLTEATFLLCLYIYFGGSPPSLRPYFPLVLKKFAGAIHPKNADTFEPPLFGVVWIFERQAEVLQNSLADKVAVGCSTPN